MNRENFVLEKDELNLAQEIESLDLADPLQNLFITDILVTKIILFFSQDINWHYNLVASNFLTQILKYSSLFVGGRDLDLTQFKNITTAQLRNFPFIFQNLQSLKIDCSDFFGDEIMAILTKFQKLCYLEITISRDTRLLEQDMFPNIEKIMIHTQSRTRYDCVLQILNVSPTLTEFSLEGGHLTMHSLVRLASPTITSISLKNVTLGDGAKDMLNSLFYGRNLKRLELLTTNNSLCDTAFVDATHDFISQLTPEIGIEELTITLDQCCNQLFDNIIFLFSLKKIRILYSAQFPSKKIIAMSQILRNFPILEVIFEEYYDSTRYRGEITEQYIEEIMARSKGFKTMLEAVGRRAITFNHKFN